MPAVDRRAEGFRQVRLPDVEIELDEPIDAYDAYKRKVDTKDGAPIEVGLANPGMEKVANI